MQCFRGFPFVYVKINRKSCHWGSFLCVSIIFYSCNNCFSKTDNNLLIVKNWLLHSLRVVASTSISPRMMSLAAWSAAIMVRNSSGVISVAWLINFFRRRTTELIINFCLGFWFCKSKTRQNGKSVSGCFYVRMIEGIGNMAHSKTSLSF